MVQSGDATAPRPRRLVEHAGQQLVLADQPLVREEDDALHEQRVVAADLVDVHLLQEGQVAVLDRARRAVTVVPRRGTLKLQ